MTAELGEAPAEGVEEPRLPGPVSDAIGELERLLKLCDGLAIAPEAAVRLAQEPGRVHHVVGPTQATPDL